MPSEPATTSAADAITSTLVTPTVNVSIDSTPVAVTAFYTSSFSVASTAAAIAIAIAVGATGTASGIVFATTIIAIDVFVIPVPSASVSNRNCTRGGGYRIECHVTADN